MTENPSKYEKRKPEEDRLLGVPRNRVTNKLFTSRNNETRATVSPRKHMALTLRDVTDYDVWNPVTVSKLKVSDRRDILESSTKTKVTESTTRNDGANLSRMADVLRLPRLNAEQQQHPLVNFRRGFTLEDTSRGAVYTVDKKQTVIHSPSHSYAKGNVTPLQKSTGPRLAGIRRSYSDVDKSIAKAKLMQRQRCKSEPGTSGKITVYDSLNDITSPPFKRVHGRAKTVDKRSNRHRDRPSTTSKYFVPSSRDSSVMNVISPRLDSSLLTIRDSKQIDTSSMESSSLEQSDYITLSISNNSFQGHRHHPKSSDDGAGDSIKKPNKSVRFGLHDEIYEYDVTERSNASSVADNNSV